jgi:hypothetical protein
MSPNDELRDAIVINNRILCITKLLWINQRKRMVSKIISGFWAKKYIFLYFNEITYVQGAKYRIARSSPRFIVKEEHIMDLSVCRVFHHTYFSSTLLQQCQPKLLLEHTVATMTSEHISITS